MSKRPHRVLTPLLALAVASCSHAPKTPSTRGTSSSPKSAVQLAPDEHDARRAARILSDEAHAVLRAEGELFWVRYTTGEGPLPSTAADDHGQLFSASSLSLLAQARDEARGADRRALQALHAWVAPLAVSRAAAGPAGALDRARAAISFAVPGDSAGERGERDLDRLLTDEPSAAKRAAIAEAEAKAAAALVPLAFARGAAEAQAIEALRLPSWSGLIEELSAATPAQLAQLAEATLVATEESATRAVALVAQENLGLTADRVRRADLPRMLRTGAADAAFPAGHGWEAARATLAGLDADPGPLPAGQAGAAAGASSKGAAAANGAAPGSPAAAPAASATAGSPTAASPGGSATATAAAAPAVAPAPAAAQKTQGGQARIRIDADPAPAKGVRPLALLVDPPDDVRLSLRPAGGYEEQRALLHEGARAAGAALTRVPRWELAQLGDGSAAEGVARLFEQLTGDPLWLRETTQLRGEPLDEVVHTSAALRLLSVRRAAALVLFEVRRREGPQAAEAAAALYRGLLQRATHALFSDADAGRWPLEADGWLRAGVTLRAALLAAQLEARLAPSRDGSAKDASAKDGSAKDASAKGAAAPLPWWRSPEARATLHTLWRGGRSLRAEEAAELLGAPLDPAVLARQVDAALSYAAPDPRPAAQRPDYKYMQGDKKKRFHRKRRRKN